MFAEFVPTGIVTKTLAVPAAPAGVVAVIVVAFTTVTFVAAVPLGIGGAGFLANFNGLVQQKYPADMRGRLLALSAVAFLGSTPVGGPVTGVIADSWGPEWSLAYGSLISLVAIAVAFVAMGFPARIHAVAPK